MTRVFRAVLIHPLQAASHEASSSARARRWYFELPAARDTPEAWDELLRRIVAAQHVMAGRAGPDDERWLGLGSFEVGPIDPGDTLAWPAMHDTEHTESISCWWVDDDGRYGPMPADEFGERIAVHRSAAGDAGPTPEPSPATPATVTPAPPRRPEADEFDDPPPRRSYLLHPSTIAMLLVLVLLATCAISNVRDRVQRSAIEQALAPLDKEWSALQEQARARLAGIEALLAAAGPPREDGCGSLTGAVNIIHRPMLTELTEGATAPRPGPLWLNSDAWLYLALARTPGRDVDAHRRRNEVVREAIARPCLGVLELEHASDARAVEAHRFDGGEVAGRLRIVCLDDARVACEVTIVSRPSFAISVVQRDARGQGSADAAAVGDAATRAYWQAVEVALAGRAPDLRAEQAPAVAP